MVNITKSTRVGPSMVDLLNNVNVSESKRELAKAHVRDAEFIADLISRAVSGVASAVAGIEHGFATMAARVKSSFDKLAHH
jgi:hypothetical protein